MNRLAAGGRVLVGNGFLALWNGVDPARASEYDLWHTREHVPERVGVPGMISAHRYVDGDGPLPTYLTLYDLQDLAVLASHPYRALLERPTSWSSSMRPSFRGFLRLACRPLARLGGGTGGVLMATTLGLRSPAQLSLTERELADLLKGVLAIPAVTAAHIAIVAPDVPSVPFTIGGELPDYPVDAVLMVEGFNRGALTRSASAIDAWFNESVLRGARTVWTSYSLGYSISRNDVPLVVRASRPSETVAE